MTNLPQPPRTSYKAFLWDYDSLLTYSDNECCFSLSQREVQIILAQLDPIAWKTRYKPTETEIDLQTILRWQGNLARKLMSGCCPDEGKIYRFDEDGELESSIDGGETWISAPEDDPRLTAPLFTPLPGGDGSEKRCVAANNAVGQIKAQADQVGADAAAWGSITLLIAAILGILAFLSIFGSGGLLTPLIVGLAGTMLTAGRAAFIAAMTNEVYETLCCALYCNMQPDGSLTEANIIGVKIRLNAELTGIARDYLLGVVNALGSVGLTNAGRTTSSDFDFDCTECDCGCSEGCEQTPVAYQFDSTAWTVHGAYTRYNASTPPGSFDSFNLGSVNAVLDFGSTACITKVEITVNNGCPGTGADIELFIGGISRGVITPADRVGCGAASSGQWDFPAGVEDDSVTFAQVGTHCVGGYDNLVICSRVTFCL